jgi:hypothetical protein
MHAHGALPDTFGAAHALWQALLSSSALHA